MIAGFGIIGFRDPNGIRPVGIGKRKSPKGYDYLIASESVVHDALGFSDFEDIKPGEAVIITRDNAVSRRQIVEPLTIAPDMFEYVYFARPDSVLDGISVYRSRLAMGEALAEQVLKVLGDEIKDIDVVIPVPDTSRVAALQVSHKLNILYREGFIKNRYVGRTFIMPGQQMRRKNVRRKLNAMALEFSGKNVLIVDDSIVRGTTSKEIVLMARDAGAKKVYVASCAPAIRYSNVYGIDMPSRMELVAHGRTDEEVANEIGADRVIFQSLPDLVESCRKFNPTVIKQFDCSVFNGKYVTGGVDEAYFTRLEKLRADHEMLKRSGNPIAIALAAGEEGSSPTVKGVNNFNNDSSQEPRSTNGHADEDGAHIDTMPANGNLAASTPNRKLNGHSREGKLATYGERMEALGFEAPAQETIGLYNSYRR